MQPVGVYPTRPTGVWTRPGITPMHTPLMGQMGGAAARADEGLAPQRPTQQHNSPARATRRMRDQFPNGKAKFWVGGVAPTTDISATERNHDITTKQH